MNYPPVMRPEPEPLSEVLVDCPACKTTGWIIGTLNEKTRPCLDALCIEGHGQVPENYTPEKQP